MARMLKQKVTGRLYKYHEQLAQRGDMVEVEKEVVSDPLRRVGGKYVRASEDDARKEAEAAKEAGDQGHEGDPEGDKEPETPASDGVTIVVDGEAYPLDKVSRSVLADYAERHFGESLDRRKAAKVLAGELKALIDERGHPDAEE